MLSSLIQPPGRLRIGLVLALLYCLDAFLLSLPSATDRTLEFVLPLTLAVGLSILAWATRLTLHSNRETASARA